MGAPKSRVRTLPLLTRTGLLILGSWGAAPESAFAQAAIAGSVTDASGGAVPGVTVEAESPALIEKTRTTVTDHSGRYRIENLRPGTYGVRFSLPGWQPHEVSGIELTGSRTVRADAVLALDRLTSDVTVFARAIDVGGTHREVSLSGETVGLLPTARTYNALLVLVPGVVTNTNDVVMEAATTSFPIHGGRATEGRLLLDGLTIGSPPSGNSAASYATQAPYAQEVVFTTSSVSGETETGGLVIADGPAQRREHHPWLAVRERQRHAVAGQQPDTGPRATGDHGGAVFGGVRRVGDARRPDRE